MLPDLTLPASLAGLLLALRPVFTGPSFATFCGLAAGLAGQVRRRTVCGMLLGAGLSRCWPHDRAHYFFARAAWDLDELGLAVARLVVALLVPARPPLRGAGGPRGPAHRGLLAAAPAAGPQTRPPAAQGPPAGHPGRGGRRRVLDPGHRAHLRPGPGRGPGRDHLPVVRLPGHP